MTSRCITSRTSGGSTGTPKLIPRTHNDYYYSIRESDVICGVNADTRYLIALPAAHNFPMSSPGALGVFYAGGQVILAADPSATGAGETSPITPGSTGEGVGHASHR